MQEQITLTLTSDLVQKLRNKAAAKGFANESEYLQEHLSETVDENDTLEEWLQTVGVERYDAYDANPQDVFTPGEVLAHVRQRLNREKDQLRSYIVEFSAGAQEDAADLAAYIAFHSSRAIAENYIARLVEECTSLALSPYRGTIHRNLRPNMRLVAYKRAVSILFRVEEQAALIVILGFAYRGRTIKHILQRHE